MRVAALAFGVFAGLVASLILALGGLDVPPDIAADESRQAQAIRFGLFVIGNLGVFGAALALAAPLAGGILFLLAALLWVVAALLLHHSTDLALLTPPVLLLLAAIPAFVAHFRRPDAHDEEDLELDRLPPLRPARPVRRAPLVLETSDDDDDDEAPEVGMPAYFPEPEPEPRPAVNFVPPLEPEWNPKRRRPPPPSARAAFRQLEPEDDDDEDDDEEPSGLSRFALGASSFLSFGLYAGLAIAALLAIWTLRDIGSASPAVDAPSPAVAEAPPPAAASSEPQQLAPILTAAPRAPVLTAAPSVAPDAEDDFDFGDVVMSDNPLAPPRLSGPGTFADPAPAAEPLPEPEPAAEDPPPVPSVAAPGRPVPYPIPPAMAALRDGPATAPVAAAPPPADLTGL